LFCTESQTSDIRTESQVSDIWTFFVTSQLHSFLVDVAEGSLSITWYLSCWCWLPKFYINLFFIMNSWFLLLESKSCVWLYVITLPNTDWVHIEKSVACSSIILCHNMSPTRDISLSSGTNKTNLLWCIGIEWSVTE